MQAFLDDSPLATDRPTLAAALRAASTEAERHGRIVVEVFVDGEQAGDELIETPSDDPIGGEVRLVSIDPRLLVRETLLNCIIALDEVNREQLQCADLIQSGRTEEALAPLGHAITTWQAIRDALERSSAILLGRASLDSDSMASLLDSLAANLEAIRASLSRQDWPALADALAYDMPEQVDQWKAALDTLANTISPPTSSD